MGLPEILGGWGRGRKRGQPDRGSPPPPQMLKKLEQTKKKAEAVVNTVDISEREKAAQLRR